MSDIQEIDPPAAKELLEAGSATFVDVRDPYSYEEAHVPGAVSLSDSNVEEFASTADKERPLIVYCYHGISSLGGAAFFMEQGFRQVYSLRGGFEHWRTGNPIEPS